MFIYIAYNSIAYNPPHFPLIVQFLMFDFENCNLNKKLFIMYFQFVFAPF